MFSQCYLLLSRHQVIRMKAFLVPRQVIQIGSYIFKNHMNKAVHAHYIIARLDAQGASQVQLSAKQVELFHLFVGRSRMLTAPLRRRRHYQRVRRGMMKKESSQLLLNVVHMVKPLTGVGHRRKLEPGRLHSLEHDFSEWDCHG